FEPVYVGSGSKREFPHFGLMSASSASSGHWVANASAALCRYCCKSPFAQVTKNSPGRRRDVRVKMWGTSSPDHKLTGDLGNGTEATKIGGCRSDRLIAGNLAPSNFGVLQQNLRRTGLHYCAAV